MMEPSTMRKELDDLGALWLAANPANADDRTSVERMLISRLRISHAR
jgi:hypothetical protein